MVICQSSIVIGDHGKGFVSLSAKGRELQIVMAKNAKSPTKRVGLGYRRNLRRLFLWQGADHHDHLTAFHFGHVFDFADLCRVSRHPLQQFATQIQVGHFATAKAQRHFYLVAVFQKFENVAHFDFIIMRIGIWSKLDLFDLNNLLLFTRFAFPLLLFIFELAEIHDLAHGRVGIWRDLNQVQPGLIGHLHGTHWRDNADVSAISANQADFGGVDLFVDARAGIALRRRIMRSSGYGFSPWVIDEN